MPRYRVVIKDAQQAHNAEMQRNIEANVKVHGERQRLTITAMMKERYNHAPRPVGTVHDETDSECPDGLLNCRNCGDPNHEMTCKAAGHCIRCGIQHGIAPTATLDRNGYSLEVC